MRNTNAITLVCRTTELQGRKQTKKGSGGGVEDKNVHTYINAHKSPKHNISPIFKTWDTNDNMLQSRK